MIAPSGTAMSPSTNTEEGSGAVPRTDNVIGLGSSLAAVVAGATVVGAACLSPDEHAASRSTLRTAKRLIRLVLVEALRAEHRFFHQPADLGAVNVLPGGPP